MKKKIILLAVALMLFAGVVSASSINGDYKGNPIVTVTSNGKLLETDEVPGVILDGHTVVPISLLRQLGASVTWDAYGYSVNVVLPQSGGPASAAPDIKDLKSSLSDEVSFIEYTANSDDVTQLSFSLKFDVGSDNIYMYQQVIGYGTESGVQQLRLVDQRPDGFIYFYKTSNIRDQLAGKITDDEFQKRIEIHSKLNNQPQINPPQQPTPAPVSNNSNVQNGDTGHFQFSGVSDFLDSYHQLHIAGQIKNISGKDAHGGVEITITLFDQKGNVVAVQTGYAQGASSFRNGETASFDISFYSSTPDTWTRYEIKAKS